MTVSNKQVRDAQRAVHLVLGLLLALYVYTPVRDLPLALFLAQVVLIPLLIASGLAMWQWPRLRRRLSRPAAAERSPSATR
jgi:hypothetical protein